MNKNVFNTCNDAPQAAPRSCPPKQDPLKEALIATASLRLHLRYRRDSSPRRLIVIDRLLEVSDVFGRSIERLRGRTAINDCGLEKLEPFATDSRAVPDAIGTVAL
jgi:hypothetical protein